MLISTVNARWVRSVFLALAFLFTNTPVFGQEGQLTGWKLHEKSASDLVKAQKYEEALDEFVATYLAMKEEHLEQSMPAINLYRDYKQALSLAQMSPESTAISSALLSLQPRIHEYVVLRNNEGVRALQASDFKLAVQRLEECLRLDSTYKLGQENLAIAYNNYGLYSRQHPNEALALFRKSVLVDSASPTSRSNLEGMLRITGKNPMDFNQRITMGNALLKQGDNLGAYVEFSEALRLKADPAIRAKIDTIPLNDPILVALKVKERKIDPVNTTAQIKDKLVGQDVDFGPYMENLQKVIKKAWLPPKGNISKKVSIVFKVSTDGIVSDAKILHSSGSAAHDQAAVMAARNVGRLPLPKGAAASVDIEFTFEYNVVGESVERKKYADHEKQEKIDHDLRLALEGSISRIRQYYERQQQSALVESLLKQAAEDKENAIALIAQVNSIAPGDYVASSFDTAVKALGKNPKSEDDLMALAAVEERDKNWQSAVFVLNCAPQTTNAKLKHERRSTYAFFIASELSVKPKTAEDVPYNLFTRKEDLSHLLQNDFPTREPEKAKDFPPLPKAIDLTAFIEAAPADSASATKKGSESATSLAGTDDKVATGVDAIKELEKLSQQLAKDSGNQPFREKQSVLLVQFGNTLLSDSPKKAANRYREALYVLPTNSAAAAKLNECLTKQGIDPAKPKSRLDLFNELYDGGQKEAAIVELKEYAKLVDDGPSTALLGLCLLEDYSQSNDGYKSLIKALNQSWPDGTNSCAASAHVVVARLLQRDAETAKNANDKSKILNDLYKESSEFRLAATFDPKSSDALDGLLEVAKEGVRYNNNATNNIMLGGAHYLKGNKDLARGCYGLALNQSPRDPAVRAAYDKYKVLSEK